MAGLLEMVCERSSLTTIQLETVLLHLAVSRGDFSLAEALSKRKGRPISRGTYYRIVSQARRNLIRGIFALTFAIRTGLVKQEDLERFLSTVSKIPSDISEDDAASVMSLVDALAKKVVML